MQHIQKITRFLPSPTIMVLCLVAPLLFTSYFVITLYREAFIRYEHIDYFAVQRDILGRLFIEQQWAAWLDRFVNFAFWGVAAAILLVLIWAVGAARISLANHSAIENFRNFRISKATWHGMFVVRVLLKGLLTGIALYLLVVVLVKAVPALAMAVGMMIDNPSWARVWQVIQGNVFLWLLQIGVATCAKTLHHIQVE